MSFDTSLGYIDLTLDLFKQEEYLFFSSICYFKTKDDLYNKNVNLFLDIEKENKIESNQNKIKHIKHEINKDGKKVRISSKSNTNLD